MSIKSKPEIKVSPLWLSEAASISTEQSADSSAGEPERAQTLPATSKHRRSTIPLAASLTVELPEQDKLNGMDPTAVFRTTPHERIRMFKQGVPARKLDVLAEQMGVTKDLLVATLRLSKSTLHRKRMAEEALTQDESERLLGLVALIGQVQVMVEESGNPAGFNAAAWFSHWMQLPLPALGGVAPARYLDSIEGQKLVSTLLSYAQSGAYA